MSTFSILSTLSITVVLFTYLPNRARKIHKHSNLHLTASKSKYRCKKGRKLLSVKADIGVICSIGPIQACICEPLMMTLSRCHGERLATLTGGNRAEEHRKHLAMLKWERRNTYKSLLCVYLLSDSGEQLCGKWWMSFKCCWTDKHSNNSPSCVLSYIISLMKVTKTLDGLMDLGLISLFSPLLVAVYFSRSYVIDWMINCNGSI